jgi:hypothetical protein
VTLQVRSHLPPLHDRSAADDRPVPPGPAWWLVVLCYALLLTGFVMTNPPGEASDEPAHFYKAAALAHGDVLGEPATITEVNGWTPTMLAWLRGTTREFEVPAHLTGCDAFGVRTPCASSVVTDRPVRPGHQVSYVGTYSPVPYLPAAVGIRVAEAAGLGPDGTVRAARAAGAAVDMALVGLAGWLVLQGSRRWLGLLGLAVTLTPLVVFTMSQVGNSGREIAGAVCFTCALLRLTAPSPGRRPTAVWVVAAVSGFLFVTARSTSPVFCAFIVGVVLLARHRSAWDVVRSDAVRAAAAAGVVAVGVALTIGWELAVQPRPQVAAGQVVDGLPFALGRLDEVADQIIGRLGWIHVRLERQTVYLWWSLLLAVLAAGLALGSWWDRAALLLGGAGAVVLTLLVDAGVQQPASLEFQMQARYVFAAGVVLPLLAADAARRRPTRPHWLSAEALLCLGATAVVLQLSAGALVLYDREYVETVPPLGWGTWQVLTTLAVLVGVVGAALAAARGLGERSAER